jgi:putative membrane protein
MDDRQQRSANPLTDGAKNGIARPLLIGVVALALVLVLGPFVFMALMMLGMGGMMGGMMGQSGAMTWPGVMVIASWLLVVVGVVLLLIWSFRRFRNRTPSAVDESPLTILQRRYARGELGPDEYARIREDLLRDRGEQ